MTNQEFKIKMLYDKYGCFVLDVRQLGTEIKLSCSGIYKIFSDFSEKQILEHKLLPTWKKVSGRRVWNISDVIEWLDETESVKHQNRP
ncbi:hypothetical protein [Sulfurimonas sp. C5]|uniref:hypothetical protein n=1 Tax=Sulfurimonas sp. C5 TaxID=3036947 RepID=UPI0024572B07|nr:hypothetical protein [Sulfurimonas sp. C5]MDH4943966.1 hypothetical protein [Sulfurimonas sp. C5]